MCGFSLNVLLCSIHPYSGSLSVVAIFNQTGITGSVAFTQATPSSPTMVSVGLQGLGAWPYMWHVYQYPSPSGVASPCSLAVVGSTYDPLQALQLSNYSQLCAANLSMCAAGDLSGRYGSLNNTSGTFNFSDAYLSLYGVHSVIGRSVVLNWNSTWFACANIGFPISSPPQTILYAPFRVGFSGNVYFQSNYYGNSTAVFADLYAINGLVNSRGHNWHIHEQPVSSSSNCSVAMGHYNPLGVQTDGNYSLSCTPTLQTMCEVGDLSGKGGSLTVADGEAKLLYTDTTLPLLPHDGNPFYIIGRSLVIHGPNGSLSSVACTNVSELYPVYASALLSGSGVIGAFRFRQATPFDVTTMTIELTGLNGMVSSYHINTLPVQGQDCGATGDIWNPTGVPHGVASTHTSDQFQVGDLSGKFGNLTLNSVNYTFIDPNISLFGKDAIIGRSIVLSFGSSWVCGNIQYETSIFHSIVYFNGSGFRGSITFSQPANDPYSPTTIIVEFSMYPNISLPSNSVVSSLATVSFAISAVPSAMTSTALWTNSIPSPMTSLLSTTTSVPSPTNSVPSLTTSVPSQVTPVAFGVTSVFPGATTIGTTATSNILPITTVVTPADFKVTSTVQVTLAMTSVQSTLLDSLVPSSTPMAMGKRDTLANGMGKRDTLANGMGKRDTLANGMGKRDTLANGKQQRAKRQQLVNTYGFSWSLQVGSYGDTCGPTIFNPFNTR